MKQGNPNRKLGLVAFLSAIFSGALPAPKGVTKEAILQRKNNVLINYGNAPIPPRILNQRQKRKRFRQSHTCK